MKKITYMLMVAFLVCSSTTVLAESSRDEVQMIEKRRESREALEIQRAQTNIENSSTPKKRYRVVEGKYSDVENVLEGSKSSTKKEKTNYSEKKSSKKPYRKSSRYYIVQKGDNFDKIARKLGMDRDELVALNGGNINLDVGDRVRISGKVKRVQKSSSKKKESTKETSKKSSGYYIVKKGDNFDKIARKLGIDREVLVALNNGNINLDVGDRVKIKGSAKKAKELARVKAKAEEQERIERAKAKKEKAEKLAKQEEEKVRAKKEKEKQEELAKEAKEREKKEELAKAKEAKEREKKEELAKAKEAEEKTKKEELAKAKEAEEKAKEAELAKAKEAEEKAKAEEIAKAKEVEEKAKAEEKRKAKELAQAKKAPETIPNRVVEKIETDNALEPKTKPLVPIEDEKLAKVEKVPAKEKKKAVKKKTEKDIFDELEALWAEEEKLERKAKNKTVAKKLVLRENGNLAVGRDENKDTKANKNAPEVSTAAFTGVYKEIFEKCTGYKDCMIAECEKTEDCDITKFN